MVEQSYNLDAVFGSLSNSVRRDMLKRISQHGLSVGEVAKHYEFSLAGVAKHLEVLEHAGLVRKTRQGKEQIVTIEPLAFAAASGFLEAYKQFWEQRLDTLDKYVTSINAKGANHD